MIDRLVNLDRRIIFLFVFLGVAIPLAIDFSFPIKPSADVISLYDGIERVGEKEDGVVLLCFSYGASTEPEMQPMALAVLRHLFRQDLRVVVISLWPDAHGLAQEALRVTAAEFDKVYGEDYVNMGYKPGTYSVILNMGQDFHSAFPFDVRGTPSNEGALTAVVSSLADFDFVVDLAAGDSIEYWWIPYGQEKFGFPLGAGCTAVMAPDLFPFLQSGQLVGLMGGLAGASEYEALVGQPGSATSGMRAQSITHLVIIAFILFGNAAYFLTRKRT